MGVLSDLIETVFRGETLSTLRFRTACVLATLAGAEPGGILPDLGEGVVDLVGTTGRGCAAAAAAAARAVANAFAETEV